MDKKNIYATPKAKNLETPLTQKKASVALIALSIILVLINGFLTLVMMDVRHTASHAIGQLLSVILIPLIVIALFQIGRGFRNNASQVKVFFWTSVIILISRFANLLSMVPATDY